MLLEKKGNVRGNGLEGEESKEREDSHKRYV